MEIEKTVHAMLRLGEQWEVASCEFEQEAATFYIVIRETPVLWEKERCAKDGA